MELVGRLTADAVVATLKNDRKVVNFSIAINDSFKPKGSSEQKKLTTYFNCSYWISPKIAEWLTKGSLVEVSGRVYATAYISNSAEAKATLHVHVNSLKIHFANNTRNKVIAEKSAEDTKEDLPF